MKRRLELVRALITRPAILFLDEPTLGLDPQGRTQIWDYMRNLKMQTKMTVLLTTHYLDEAQQLADRVGIMDKGKLIVDDSPSVLIEQLGADTITILGKGDRNTIKEKLIRFEYIQSFSEVDNGFLIGLQSSSKHLAEVVAIVNSTGFSIEDISVLKPDLGAVFIKYTGHTLGNGDTQ